MNFLFIGRQLSLNRFLLAGLFPLLTSFALHAQSTTWVGGSGPGDFTNGSNWNNGAPLGQAATVDTTSGTVTFFLTAPTPNPYSISSLTVAGSNALTFNQTSSTLTIASGPLDFGTSNSIYNLTGTGAIYKAGAGSILQVGGTNGITGTGTLNLTGGIIQVINSNLTVGGNVTTTLSGDFISTVDTSSLNASFNGSITGNTSGLLKLGSGNLTLNGANNTMGTFGIDGGTVIQTTGTITTAELAVGGGAGNTGNYNMSGGNLIFPAGTPPAIVGGTAASFRIGDFQGTGTFTQTNGNVVVNGGMDIGNEGGNGTYNISGGSLLLSGGLYALGRTTSSAAATSSGAMNISGTAVVTVANGNFIIGDRDSGGAQGAGVVTQTGGTFVIAPGAALYLAAYGNGIYNLNGGVLQVGGSGLNANYAGTGSYQFNWGGGEIMVTGTTALSTSVNINLTPNVYSIIDTNGLGATLSGTINGATGGLYKFGANDLALAGSKNTIGSFLIAGGGVTQSTGTLTTAELAVGTGTVTGTPGGLANNGSYTMSGGTLVITGGTPPAIAGSSSSFRVGDFGGNGTFTQTAGSVVLGTTGTVSLSIGNKGGNGTYNLQGGSLTLLGPGYIDLGLSTSTSYGTTTGTMNISGGTLEIGSRGYLALGDNNSGLPASSATGVLNQTGGTIIIDAGGNFYLSGYGTGTYNFSGGILTVGGTSVQSHVGAAAANTNFNWGGGTIQVSSDLTTNANATLVGTTTSTLATGAFNATWTGSLTGSGNLLKTGTGSLTVSHINTTGLLDLQGGTAVSSSASNVVGQLYADGGNTVNLQVGAGNALTILPVGTTTAGRVYENSTLNIFGGGTVNIEGAFAVGRASVASPGSPSSGTLNITGNTQLNFDYSGYTNMFVGAGSGVAGTQGTVNQQNTSKVILGSNMIIGADNATAVYNLTDTATLTTSTSPTSTIYIGLNQMSADTAGTTNGTLNITGSASFTVGQGSQMFVGAGDNRAGDGDDALFGATGLIVQNGAGSLVTFDTNTNAVWFGALMTDTPGSITGGIGTYELDAGTLNLKSGNVAFGGSAGTTGYLNQNGGTLTASTTTLVIGQGGTGIYNLGGGTASFNNGITVGANTGSLGTVNQTAGTVNLTGGSINLKQATSTYNLYGGTLAVGGSGITGAGQLNISSGTLNTGTGTATGTGGTLTGSGPINVATVVSNGGVIAPGSTSAGVHTSGAMTFSSLTFNTGSIYDWNLASESTSGPGTSFDQIIVAANGNVLFNDTLTVNLSFGSSVNFADSFWTSTETWALIDVTASGASISGTPVLDLIGGAAPNGSFSATQSGNEIVLTWTPVVVPEPSTYLLVLAGTLLLIVISRRQRRTR